MPELPEVQTTVSGLSKVLPGLRISSVWSDLPIPGRTGETIKNGKYFQELRAEITGKKILSVSRRGKNILISLEGGLTLLVHMKMTGHLLYGTYQFDGATWKPKEKGPLQDPYNRFIHLVFTLSNRKHLAFSDARKFGKVALLQTEGAERSPHLRHLGPEPLSPSFTYAKFKERIGNRPKGKIKQVLMDQSVIAGIGNIYSDEILWHAGIHPEEQVRDIPPAKTRAIFDYAKKLLRKGVDFGGDSTSDYRNIHGEPGTFHYHHRAYRQTGKPCSRKGCGGAILRKAVGGRSAHFCDTHQKLR